MKRITLVSTALLLVAAQSTNAQFLNKLKKKAQSALEKVVDGKDANADSTVRGQGNTGTSFPGDKGKFDASKYGVPVFEMQADERVVYGEHTLSIVSNQTVVKVVTRVKNEYFLYENDKRSGPFAKPPVEKLDNWHRGMDNDYDADDKKTDPKSYISRGILTVDGKGYGEVMSMGAFYHSKAKKKFYAVTFKLNQYKPAYYFVTEKGSRQLPFVSNELYISDNDEIGGIMITATQFEAKTDEARMKFVLNDDIYIVLSNGKNIGPLKSVAGEKAYLDNAGNFVQISTSRKAIFINGKQVAPIPEDSYGQGKFFAGNNGEGGAWFERGNLFFSDGTTIKNYALQPATSVEGGKQVLNWLSIQNKKVYLCKKDL